MVLVCEAAVADIQDPHSYIYLTYDLFLHIYDFDQSLPEDHQNGNLN